MSAVINFKTFETTEKKTGVVPAFDEENVEVIDLPVKVRAAFVETVKRRGVDLLFKNLTYRVKFEQSGKVIKKNVLDNITGFARPGELLAIMGSSGAGKTSLLNILSNKVSPTSKVQIEGELLANGTTYQSDFGKFAAYVMQNDVLMHTFTPEEALSFSAQLRLPGTRAEKTQIIENLLLQLKLQRARHTLIGSPELGIKGISGGERRRTSIGVELITNPSVLFLDEPTSGLDSFTSWAIINMLKKQALKNNTTVVFTIHQPNGDTFRLFDRLLLLVEGKFIYQGAADEAVQYFNLFFL